MILVYAVWFLIMNYYLYIFFCLHFLFFFISAHGNSKFQCFENVNFVNNSNFIISCLYQSLFLTFTQPSFTFQFPCKKYRLQTPNLKRFTVITRKTVLSFDFISWRSRTRFPLYSWVVSKFYCLILVKVSTHCENFKSNSCVVPADNGNSSSLGQFSAAW